MSDRRRFCCEGGCGAEWINPNHTRCEGCGHNRGPYSIGYHAAWLAATKTERESCVTRAAAALESTSLNPPQRHFVLSAIRDKETK